MEESIFYKKMSIKIIKKKKKVGKKLVFWLLKLTILFFVFYTIYILINQYVKINTKKEQLSSLSSQLSLQMAKNEELKKISQATAEENEKYFEKEARKLNLSKPKERIFANISGN